MTSDIKSMIQEFYQENTSLKSKVSLKGMGKTSQNFGSISASITSYDHKRSVYDPYDVTNFEETPVKNKSTPGAPLKIKLSEG